MDLLLAHPGIFLFCGLLNVLATFSYVGFLYLSRYFDSFAFKLVVMIWESTVFLGFSLQSLLNFSTSFNKIGYALSFTGITDAISIVGLTTYLYLDFHTAFTLQFFRCFRLLKIMQGVKSYPHLFHFAFVDPVPYEILHACVSVVVFLLIMTGAVQALSHVHPHAFEFPVLFLKDGVGPTDSFVPNSMLWHDCLYFVVVTVTTVGYGDIFPVTTLSRMLMVLIMIAAFSLIPTLLSDLVRAFYSRPLYSGSLSLPSGRKHIVICGIVNSAMLFQLHLELKSYHHPTCGSAAWWQFGDGYSMNNVAPFLYGVGSGSVLVVILSPQLPNQKVKLLLDAVLATYARRVMYFVGSTKVAKDLQRVKLQDALAVLILGDEPTSSLRVEEDSIFLSAISISNYLESWLPPSSSSSFSLSSMCSNNDMRIPGNHFRPHLVTALTHTAKFRPLLLSAGVDVVLPFQNFKYTLLGVAVGCPGVLALFMKLNRPHFESYSEQYPQRIGNQNVLSRGSFLCNVNVPENLPFLKSTGSESSIYQINVMPIDISPLQNSFFHGDDDSDNSESNAASRPVDRTKNFCSSTKWRDDMTAPVSVFIRNLPVSTSFRDFVSVVYRLSCGDVVLIGVRLMSRTVLSKQFQSQWQNIHDQGQHLYINPDKQFQMNQCSDLFCIAKSRSTAIQTIKLACRGVGSIDLVEGTRGAMNNVGSCQSFGRSKFLRGYFDRSNLGNVESKKYRNSLLNERRANVEVHDEKECRSPYLDKSCQEADSSIKLDEFALTNSRSVDDKTAPKGVRSLSSRKSRCPVCHNKGIRKSMWKRKISSKVKNNRLQRPLHPSRLKRLSPFSFLPCEDAGSGSTDQMGQKKHALTTLFEIPKEKTMLQSSARSCAGCFDMSFGNEASSLSNGTGHKLYDDDVQLRNHLVLIMSSSGSADSISAHILLMPIIHLLTAYRAHSPNDKVVVLSERANELHSLTSDASTAAYPSVLHSTHYYLGSPRNMDHLRVCGVQDARAVVVCQHPMPSTVFVPGDDNPVGLTVPKKLSADRHSIIVSLNLHFLLGSQDRLPHQQGRNLGVLRQVDDHVLENDSYCPYTFAVVEVRHESNVAYLRRSISTISTPSDAVPDFLAPEIGNCVCLENSRFDMLSAGGVLTAPVFVSLMLQSILNPNVVTLWEILLSGQVNVSDHGTNDVNSTVRAHTVGTTYDYESRKHQQQPCHDQQRQSATISKRIKNIPILGRIVCPAVYDGATYGELFEDLLKNSGVLCIGVHRFVDPLSESGDSRAKFKEMSQSSNDGQHYDGRGVYYNGEEVSVDDKGVFPLLDGAKKSRISDQELRRSHLQSSSREIDVDSPLPAYNECKVAHLDSDGLSDVASENSSTSKSPARSYLEEGYNSSRSSFTHGAKTDCFSGPKENTLSASSDNVSLPYTFIAPATSFAMRSSDYILILRGP